MKLTWNHWLFAGVLVAVTLALYARTVRFGFVHLDDPEYVFRNPHTLAGLNAENVRYAFTTFELSNWHPLTWLSYMLDVSLFGGARPGPMHVVNVAIHAANAALVFVLLLLMTASTWRSAIVAALFALHPLRVESVAWISERKDVLSTFFGLLAMLAYVRHVHQRSAWAYGLVIVSFAISLLAKPMLVTLPFLLLLLDIWPLRRIAAGARAWQLVLEKVPMFVLAVASSLMTMAAQSSAMSPASLQARLANAVVSYMAYLRDTFWPADLAVLYPFPRELSLLLVVGCAIALLVTTVTAVLWARRFPHLLVGWLWYLGTLVPVIGLVAVGQQARADRYTYFPQLGIFIMIAWSMPRPRGRLQTVVAGAAAGAILVGLGAATWRQLGYWRDSERLFERCLAVCGPHPSTYLNYGIAMSDRNEHERALSLYDASLALRPNSAKTLNSKGNALLRMARFESAVECYRQAIAVDPNFAPVYFNLGTALASHGHLAEGEQMLREALRRGHAAARQNLNTALRLQGKPPE